MNYDLIKNNVLSSFKDYHDLGFIEDIIKRNYNFVKNEYLKEDNLSEDIFCAMRLKNIVYYELLHSNRTEDQVYMKKVCDRFTNIAYFIKLRKNEEVAYFKEGYEVYDICKSKYDNKHSFSTFVATVANGYYNGFDKVVDEQERKEYLKMEKDYLETLKNMHKIEKKLKFKF
ncbi:MAG: hypothetical protein J6O56_05845 [Bacilli bacterium]|nr:hypothetical protein [Bacilli bacterium]